MQTKVALTDVVMLGGPPSRVIVVDVPDGWHRVWRGALKPDDLYLQRMLALDGIVTWVPMGESDERGPTYQNAEVFTCVIRIGEQSVDHPCERCEVRHRERGNRFCWYCCRAVILEQRKQTQTA